MWYVLYAPLSLISRAFDLEKRQHAFAAGELEPLRPDETGLLGGTKYQVARVEEKAANAKDEMKKDL